MHRRTRRAGCLACLLVCWLGLSEVSWSKPQSTAEEHFRHGQELQKAGDLHGAAEEYRAAIRMDPNLADAHIGLGVVLGIGGKLEEARTECAKAAELRPESAEAHNCLGAVLRDSGDLKGATREFRKVVELIPGAANAHDNLGVALELDGQFSEAISQFRKAMEISPDLASAWNDLAWLYATANEQKFRDGEKALEYAQKAVELSGGREAYILDTLAEAYFVNGEFDLAIGTEEKAIALEPNDPAYAIQKEKFKAAKSKKA